MAKEVTVLGIEGAFLRGVRLEERNGAFVCAEVQAWPLVAGVADGTSAAASAGEAPATPIGEAPVTPMGDQAASPIDFPEDAPVEAAEEEDKPLARALREAVKHFGQSEFTLSLPLSKLLVKSVRMPVEARADLLGAAKLELDSISPFPDEDLAPAAEVVAETDSEILALVSALPASAAAEISAALAAARVHVTRTDATALGWLRSLWPRLGEVEAQRRLVLLNLGDGWDLAVLDGDAPVQLRGIGAVDSAVELVREVTLSLLACEAGSADVDDVAVCCLEQPGADVLQRLSTLGPVRTLLVDDPVGGVEGCARREAEGIAFDVTPADWAEARTESRFRRKFKAFLAVAIGLWVIGMGVLFGYDTVYNWKRANLEDFRKGKHKRAYDEVVGMTNRVALLGRYEDRSKCALEMLRVVTECMPPEDEGMVLEFFQFKRDEGVTVKGKASINDSRRQLAEDNLAAATVPRLSQRDEEHDVEEESADEGEPPRLFADVERTDLRQNREGMFPFNIVAKFPVQEESKSEKGKSK